jgi:hypothetical protein
MDVAVINTPGVPLLEGKPDMNSLMDVAVINTPGVPLLEGKPDMKAFK